MIELADTQRFALWLAHGRLLQGWVLIEKGKAGQGIDRLMASVSGSERMGAELERPEPLAILAETHARLGKPDRWVEIVGRAEEILDKSHERAWEPELKRNKGGLLLALPEADEQ